MDDIKELYDLYSKDIYKFIISMTLNHEVAEDIMQNTFLSAIKSIKTFKGKSSIKTWLIGIAKNEYYTYLRKNKKIMYIEDEVNISAYQNINEDYYAIIQEINKLQEPNKQILILRIINDLSFKEIGSIVGKSDNYCRVVFFREKKKIVEVLKNE